MTGTRRALLIGSQTHGLSGVEPDVAELGEVLRSLGFVVDIRVKAAARADGIVGAYRELIADAGPEDTALVYYSGHGARERAPAVPAAPRWLQFIVPTDIDDVSGDRARCVLAEELSLLQLELTGRTRNVTTILDCCHAARMSREPESVPRALTRSGLPVADLERRWAELRADPRLAAVTTDSNPLAVRMVACSVDETAYERPSATLGGRRHGVLTAALIGVLTGADPAELTWREARDLVRAAVIAVADQRPEVEGPAERLLFGLATRAQTGVRPVRVVDGVALLDAAALFGSAVGDVYLLVPPRRRPAARQVTAVVDRIVDGRAVLRLTDAVTADLPAGTAAWPVDVAFGARPVAVVPAGAPGREAIAAELGRTAHVRVVDDPAGALATVRLDGGDVQLLDAGGAPLYRDGRAAATLPAAAVADDVRTLARAAWVRELPSGSGVERLDGDGVEITWLRVRDGLDDEPLEQGAHLFVGDRIVARAANRGARVRYIGMIDVGLTGALTVSSAEPDGVGVVPGGVYELGEHFAGHRGLPLMWPAGLPAGRPRTESVVTIVADARIDGLGQLTQSGVVTRSGTVRSPLGHLLEDLAVGRRGPRGGGEPVRYRVVPFDLTLHAGARPADGPAEPPFAVDERPDDSVRLVTPLPAAGDPITRIAVRLVAGVGPGPLRVDTLIVPAGEPCRATTVRVAEVPAGGLLLVEGPVGRFVDVAVWAGPDLAPAGDLPDLLAAEPAGPVPDGSAGAVARLVATAARLLGAERGVLRTVLLPNDRFGTGDGRQRYPVAGFLRAGEVSIALEIADRDARRLSGSATYGGADPGSGARCR